MPQFHKVIKTDQLANNSMKKVQIKNYEILLYKVSGKIYATDNLCTHSPCRLEAGNFDGDIIECPCHGGKFDIKTGMVKSLPPVIPIKTYRTRIRGKSVEIEV
jgi:nitrite reductase/ring-hydroxylating ferredoxin subunit